MWVAPIWGNCAIFAKFRKAPLIAVLIAALFLVVVSFPWHGLIVLVFIAICGLLIAIIGRLIWSVDRSDRNVVEAITGTLTSIAILSAGYWYVFERPGVPKIELSVETTAFPIEGDKLLLSSTVRMRNVGSTAIHFEPGQRLKIFVGQVLPATGKDFRDLTAHVDPRIADGKKSMSMIERPNWPKRASIEHPMRPDKEEGGAVIEAGEQEEFFFKGMIACRDAMVLATQAKLDKPKVLMDQIMGRDTEGYVWITQSIGEEVGECLS